MTGPIVKTVAAALLAVTIVPGAIAAQDDLAFLKAEAIRAAYERDRKTWDPAPEIVISAFVAAEDKKFFTRSPSRSTLTQSLSFWYGDVAGGGSLALSFALGQALTHEEIADWFVHRIFLGQSCFGVDGAAFAYFDKEVESLSLAEIAFLAALPKAPAAFHPIKNQQRAVERRNFVLKTMAEEGLIGPVDADEAVAAPLVVRNPLGTCEEQQN